MGVSRSEKSIHERARWTSMCFQENGLTYSRLVVQSDDSFISISCRCWFNRNFTSNCAEFSSHLLTTVDAYTPTERVFALLCLRVSGLSIRCFFVFYVLHEGCLNLFHRGLCSPIHVAYPFYFVEVCVVSLYVILLHMSYVYICHIWLYLFLFKWKCHIICFHCKVFFLSMSGAFCFSRMRCWRHATTCNWPSLRHGLVAVIMAS